MSALRRIFERRAAEHRAEAVRHADAAVELATLPRPMTEARAAAILAAARRARAELVSAESYEIGLQPGPDGEPAWVDRMALPAAEVA